MATFDPSNVKTPEAKGIPAGDYVVVIRSYVRKTSKNNNEYLNVTREVIAGAARGKKFFDMIMLNFEDEMAAYKFKLLLEGCGHVGAIDPDVDSELRKAIVNKPHKARIDRKVENGYTNNRVSRYLVGDAVTEKEREFMEQWQIDAEAAGDVADDVSGGPADEDDGYGGGGRRMRDDDIPF